MPKSRGRKNKPGGTGPPQPPLSTPRAKEKKGKLRTIVETIGAIASIIAIVGLVIDALRQPDISAEPNPDPSSPLALPFYVKNESSFFDMRETQFRCFVDDLYDVYFPPDAPFLHHVTMSPHETATIEPGRAAGFRCLIGTQGQSNIVGVHPNAVTSAHLHLYAEYRTLFFNRTSDQQEFTWYTAAKPPRWIKGKLPTN
jgi:hypothetical protein